jgi:hypothetical protein
METKLLDEYEYEERVDSGKKTTTRSSTNLIGGIPRLRHHIALPVSFMAMQVSTEPQLFLCIKNAQTESYPATTVSFIAMQVSTEPQLFLCIKNAQTESHIAPSVSFIAMQVPTEPTTVSVCQECRFQQSPQLFLCTWLSVPLPMYRTRTCF